MIRPVHRLLPTLAVLALALPGAAPAQEPPPPPDRPVDRTFGEVSQVTVVEVPVQVVHRGEPVRGLTADDFRIFDEGVRRTVESFEVVDLAVATGGSASVEAAPATIGEAIEPVGRRHFLLLFDLSFSRAFDLSRAERAARELVVGRLHTSDLVGVALYTPRRGASMLLGFTTDRRQVLRVLDGLRALLDGETRELAIDGGAGVGRADGSGRADPLGLTAGSVEVTMADLGASSELEVSLAEETMAKGWAGPLGGRGGLEANKLANMMWSAEQQIKDRRAGKISDLSRSLASLARQTAGLRGAKHLVLLSGGFDASLLDSSIEAGPRTSSPGWWASGGGDWIRREVEAMIDELKRAGWVVHAVELQGIGAAGSHREGLSLVARETGGALYDNSNDLDRALGRVIEATTVTYVLSFTADAGDSPGGEDGFRELRIEIDGLPRGARVSHRAGYRTPGARAARTPAERDADRRAELHGLVFSSRDQDGLGTAFRAAAVPEEGGRWRVPVVLDLPGPGLLEGGGADASAGVEVVGYAFGEDGAIEDFFSQRIDFASERARRVLAEGGVRFLADLELPAGGRYRVRVVARSLRSGAASVHTVPLELAGNEVVRPAAQQALLADDERWIVAVEQ